MMWALFITMLYSQVKSVCIMLKYLLLTLNPPKEFWPWLYALAYFAENNVFSNWKQVSQSNFWNIDSRSRESFSLCVNYCWTFLISNDLLRKGCWRKINACYWVADMIQSFNADLNIFSPMRLENLDARARCSHICETSWWVSHVLHFFPKCEIKCLWPKLKTDPQRTKNEEKEKTLDV